MNGRESRTTLSSSCGASCTGLPNDATATDARVGTNSFVVRDQERFSRDERLAVVTVRLSYLSSQGALSHSLSLSLFFALLDCSLLMFRVPGWGLLRLLDPKGKETEGMLAVRVMVREQEKEEGRREWLGRKFKELMK